MIRTFFFLSIVALNLIFYFFFKENEISDVKKIIIEPGMKLDQISKNLYEAKIIKNKFIFKVWVKINLAEKKLKYGEYSFDKRVSIDSALKKLTKGKSLNRKITIVEGSSKNDLLNLLSQIDPKNTLELKDISNEIIADTYFYDFSDNSRKILDNIILISKNVSRRVWENRDKSIPLSSITEMFTLASIVEKETFLKRERSLISGVFYNRFKKNMKLQSDPTVVYAITKGKNKLSRKLLRKDLKFASEFNTYLHKGLPPEPICIPGLESLQGTAKPYKSDFLYFVSKNMRDEGHLFATNYKDHLKNIKKVRKTKKADE